MATTQNLMGVGMAPALASLLGYNSTSLTGVGNATQTGAASVATNLTLGTATATNNSFILASTQPLGIPIWFYNISSVPANVYPATGGTINGGAANASISVGANIAVELIQTSNNTWYTEAVPGIVTDPPTTVTQFGSGTGTFLEEGNLSRQVSLAGISPTATSGDIVLAAYTLPASSFDIAGRGITVTADGSFVSNTDSKTVKLIYNCTTATVGSTVSGGTTIASLTSNTTAGAGGWTISASVFKAGAAGSNTQIALHQLNQSGSVAAALVAPTTNLTATESGAIIIAVTGNAPTATNDVVYNFLEVNAMN